MAPVCVLVGVPGAGKTTTGTALADLLGVGFIDTDEVIVATAGKSVPEIFLDEGEAYFRALERTDVATALIESDGGVLALGGGAILDESTRSALGGHTVVFLSVDLTDAVKRVGLGTGRPLLSINPRATLKHLMDQRRPLYRSVAKHVVRTDGRTPAEVAAEVADLLRS